MNVQARPKRLSVTQIQSRKGGDKLVCLTAYTSSVARLLDHEVDLLLVGDSLAMTVCGFDSTLPIAAKFELMGWMAPHTVLQCQNGNRRSPAREPSATI
jgi:ketopantoate hydroxymethyltransferase